MTDFIMTKEEAAKRLERVKTIFENHKKSIMRRRSWRASEKAASMADIQQDINALEVALASLRDQ